MTDKLAPSVSGAPVIPIARRQQTARTCKNCLWWSAPYQGDPSQCLGGITEGAITHAPPLASYPHTAASETCRGWEANK